MKLDSPTPAEATDDAFGDLHRPGPIDQVGMAGLPGDGGVEDLEDRLEGIPRLQLDEGVLARLRALDQARFRIGSGRDLEEETAVLAGKNQPGRSRRTDVEADLGPSRLSRSKLDDKTLVGRLAGRVPGRRHLFDLSEQRPDHVHADGGIVPGEISRLGLGCDLVPETPEGTETALPKRLAKDRHSRMEPVRKIRNDDRAGLRPAHGDLIIRLGIRTWWVQADRGQARGGDSS